MPAEIVLSDEEVAEIRAIGDNTGCMALKGGVPDHEGEERPDRWPLTPELTDSQRLLGPNHQVTMVIVGNLESLRRQAGK